MNIYFLKYCCLVKKGCASSKRVRVRVPSRTLKRDPETTPPPPDTGCSLEITCLQGWRPDTIKDPHRMSGTLFSILNNKQS